MTTTLSREQILFEDNHFIAINKAAGDLAQGDKTGDIPLPEVVKAYIAKKYNKPGAVYLGVPHRLDRPTTGCLLFCKTSKSLTRMNALFASHTPQKIYWAWVEGKPKKQKETLVHHLLRNTKQNKSYAQQQEGKDTKRAVLHYKVIAQGDHYHLLEVKLDTGRHHQIRAQLSAIGLPIKGDLKYGSKRSNKDGSIHLHARTLSFVHPVKKEPITITAPVPKSDGLWLSINK